MKRSPLPRRQSPMARSSALTRTAMRRRRSPVTPEEMVGRQLVAARSMGLCEVDPRHPAQDVHHRKNRSQGGTWAVENLLHICRRHHSAITTNPEWARGYGWALRRRENPAEIPALIYGVGLTYLLPDGTYAHLPTERIA